jgi:hypothetical protein
MMLVKSQGSGLKSHVELRLETSDLRFDRYAQRVYARTPRLRLPHQVP